MTEKKVTCFICKKTFDGDFHYCPNCGAKMPSIKDEEKRAIDAAINELFINEQEEKPKDELKILPLQEKSKEIHHEIKHEDKKMETGKILNIAGIALGIIVVCLLIFFGMKIFTSPTNQAPTNPKPVNPDVSQPVDKDEPSQKEEEGKAPINDLKEGIDVEFDSELSDMQDVVTVDKINIKMKDDNAITLTYYYTSKEALTITFADSANSFNAIGIDVPSGSSSVYFDLSKSLLKSENDFIVTLSKTGESGIQPAVVTIRKNTVKQILEKMN